MPIIDCPIDGCTYATTDVEAAVVAALLMVHNNVHTGTAPATTKQKALKIDRPCISKGSSEEIWNSFCAMWQLFKQGTALMPAETVRQLFRCCNDELGNDLLRGSKIDFTTTPENTLLNLIKKLAVIPVAVSVRRSDLLAIRQRGVESLRSFYARIKGKATTCAYSVQCTSTTCTQKVDFTDIIAKDVMISGLVDDEVKREVLGWHDLDEKQQTKLLRLWRQRKWPEMPCIGTLQAPLVQYLHTKDALQAKIMDSQFRKASVENAIQKWTNSLGVKEKRNW